MVRLCKQQHERQHEGKKEESEDKIIVRNTFMRRKKAHPLSEGVLE
jgi:hypothetical protein